MRITARGWLVLFLLLTALLLALGQATQPRPCYEDETRWYVGGGEYVCVPNDGAHIVSTVPNEK